MMTSSEVQVLCTRAAKAFAVTQQWGGILRRAYELGCPNREAVSAGWATGGGQATPGENKTSRVYDSTYQDAIERLANDLMTGLFPPWHRWFELAPGIEVPKRQADEMMSLLNEPESRIWAAIQGSNFYSALHPALVDMIFSVGVIYTAPAEPRGVVFEAIPPWDLGLEQGARGAIDTVYRKYSIKAEALEQELGPGAVIPDALRVKAEKDPTDQIPILSCVRREKETGLYEQYVCWEQGRVCLLENGPWRTNPYTAFRWSVRTGEVHGRGPALKAYSTAYSLNELMRLALLNINFATYGLYTVLDDGAFNPAAFSPRPFAMLPVGSNHSDNPTIRPLERDGSALDFAQFGLEDLRSQIRRDLFVDDLPGLDKTPKLTATEVVERQAMVAKDKGAAFGRLTSEVLVPIVDRVLEILQDQGTIPQDIKLDGQAIQVKAISPLAQAQAYDEVQAMRALIADVVAATAIDPTVTAEVDAHAVIRKISLRLGLDDEVMREEGEVEEAIEAAGPTLESLAAGGARPGAPQPPTAGMPPLAALPGGRA